MMRAINPATGETLAEYPTLSPSDLERRLALAAEAAVRWRATPVTERASVVARNAEAVFAPASVVLRDADG